jgi:hypothetical protein
MILPEALPVQTGRASFLCEKDGADGTSRELKCGERTFQPDIGGFVAGSRFGYYQRGTKRNIVFLKIIRASYSGG